MNCPLLINYCRLALIKVTVCSSMELFFFFVTGLTFDFLKQVKAEV